LASRGIINPFTRKVEDERGVVPKVEAAVEQRSIEEGYCKIASTRRWWAAWSLLRFVVVVGG
jgi:hypothetical protein